jgi:hypothetical protein
MFIELLLFLLIPDPFGSLLKSLNVFVEFGEFLVLLDE